MLLSIIIRIHIQKYLILIHLRIFIDTSRPPRVLEENGKNYWFMDRENMDHEIRENNFLESGEHKGNIYGTHLDSIRDVIKQGIICHLLL